MFSPVDFIYSSRYIDFKFNIFRHMGYTPGPGQEIGHKSLSRFLILCGAARFGKSLFGGAEAAVQLLLPGQRIWLVGPQYSLSEKEFNWTLDLLSRIKLQQYGGRSALSLCRVRSGDKGSQRITTPWGSFLETKTAEKPTSLWGESLTLLVLCEAAHIKKRVYDMILRGRLGDMKGRMVATSTPSRNSGLLYHFDVRGHSKEVAWHDWESHNFGVDSNPTFSREEIEAARRELPGKVFDQQYKGEFFDPREKVIDTFFEVDAVEDNIPDSVVNLPLFISVKRGYNNPTSILFVAFDQKDKLIYIIDEATGLKKNIKEWESMFSNYSVGRRFGGFIVEDDDVNLQNEIDDMGYSWTAVDKVEKSKKDEEEARIRNLREYFTQDYIRIAPNCTNILSDLENYRFDEIDEDSEKKQKEVPVNTIYKQGVDALANISIFLERNAY